MTGRVHVVGIGGTLREHSTSRAAVERALRAAQAAGATTELLDLRALSLPVFDPEKPVEAYGPAVAQLIDAARRADAMLWGTAAYHGTVAGVTKNALDFLELLRGDRPPYLYAKVVGLIATAGGEVAAVNAVNALIHVAHALRATVAPTSVAIPQAWRVFDEQGAIRDATWVGRLDQLGARVVELAARQAPTLGLTDRTKEPRPAA